MPISAHDKILRLELLGSFDEQRSNLSAIAATLMQFRHDSVTSEIFRGGQ